MSSEYFVHHLGLCESSHVGRGTRIWAFAHVLSEAVIGADCNICDHVFIENDVVIGDRVTVKSGVQLWDGLRVGDDVFIGPNATFTNDPFPRSRRRPARFAVTRVEKNASVGANATILPGVTIGAGAMIGAGAVVTRDVPARSVITGVPGRIRGYLNDDDRLNPPGPISGNSRQPHGANVREVSLRQLTRAEDMRGKIAVAETSRELPFVPQRAFLVYDVPSTEVRGEHAHRHCEQFLVCVAGAVAVIVDDGVAQDEYLLSGPSHGLHIPPRIWATQYRYTDHAALLVLASDPYDPDDYIRDYKEFLALTRPEADAAGTSGHDVPAEHVSPTVANSGS
jgi:acetyltransferase-like isoleucine patch superfamily enzyme/dTDP-4-dehydrorhamnose 3,5-epimerase-like enzyme